MPFKTNIRLIKLIIADYESNRTVVYNDEINKNSFAKQNMIIHLCCRCHCITSPEVSILALTRISMIS